MARRLFTVPSTDVLFNQYADAVPGIDRRGAAAARRRNLCRYLASYRRPPALLVVGEAVGYRGGRFTGIPLSSERLLAAGLFDFPAAPTSQGAPYAEPTATVLWSVLAPYRSQVLAWNAVPLHPHRPGLPLSNRTPTAAERRLFLDLLGSLYSRSGVRHVVALGNHAAAALGEVGIAHTRVRHPANGGAGAFRQQMTALLAQVGLRADQQST